MELVAVMLVCTMRENSPRGLFESLYVYKWSEKIEIFGPKHDKNLNDFGLQNGADNNHPLEGTTHHPNPLAVHGLESNEAMFYILSEVDLHSQTM